MDQEPQNDSSRGWVVMVVIIILCLLLLVISAGVVLWRATSSRIMVDTTQTLVDAVATAISTYPNKTWTWSEGTPGGEQHQRSYHLFDLNRDNLIDGYAAVTASRTQDGGFSAEVIASGYTGFVDMAKPAIKPSFINLQGIPIDAWKRPLRIAFAAKVYGTQNFGVWSAGPDGVDGTADDLKSWTPIP
jgi:hypothetical protein